MPKTEVRHMKFSKVYPMYVQKPIAKTEQKQMSIRSSVG